MRTHVTLILALAGLIHRADAQSPDPRASAIAVADSALAAITRGDAAALTDLMVPEAVMYPTRTTDGATTWRVRTRAEQRDAKITGVVERGFRPQALVSGGIAMVWMPYDLYVNGAWSHCGADVFTMVRTGSSWRITAMTWSAEQPPVCEKHPAGPPKQ
ncbi:MAG: nuclear transport factor 2 family protein [Gemmatimonadaceae bacterium]